MTLRTNDPVLSETLAIPKLCLTGRVPPRGTTVNLSTDVVSDMNLWPLFHNGVAAGLRIIPTASDIDSSWIVFNKPKVKSLESPTVTSPLRIVDHSRTSLITKPFDRVFLFCCFFFCVEWQQ